jgi:hypothetical protein
MLPRLLVDDEITKKDIAAMGHGGLCLQCNECRYPVCPFGRKISRDFGPKMALS